MTKIVKASEMARIEALSYSEGAEEEHFMRTAGQLVADEVQKMVGRLHIQPKILFLCGKGNNGGDGFVAASILARGGFTLQVWAFASLADSSPLSKKMRKEFTKGRGEVIEIKRVEQLDFSPFTLIVDGLFGTGFKGELSPLYHEAITKANGSMLPILAIDIPSGINGDSGLQAETAIKAHKTLFLGAAKRGCFIGEAYAYVGEFSIGNFGLEEKYLEKAEAEFTLVEDSLVKTLLPTVKRTRHKYEAGYVVGVGGSPSMPGAPILACEAALRAGAGIMRLLHPEGMGAELSGAPAEIIRQPYKEGDVALILAATKRAGALFIGPGIGTSAAAEKLLQQLLPQITLPCVLDAEALTLIAQNDLPLPKGAILTPHTGEMRRLLHRETSTAEELIVAVQEYAKKQQVVVLLKGAPTFIFSGQKVPFVVAHGDPGMATAGSGDVLTGIIAALLAQDKSSEEAAILGCYLHALAGERAARECTSYAMIASDITHHLQDAFKLLLH